MNPTRCPSFTSALVACSLVLWPATSSAQLISLRTVPIASGEQYVLLPSETLGMGGAGIALRDRLADPFGNPAMGARMRGVQAFAAPTFYGISGSQGGGRTITSGVLGRSGGAFGGIALSLQELDNPPSLRAFPPPQPAGNTTFREQSYLGGGSGNRYMHALAGTTVGNSRTSIGAGVFHAALRSVDGVRQLYANSVGLTQDGGITDVKLGVLHETDDGWIEATAVHSRVDITQDVDYQQWVWNDNRSTPPTVRSWSEQNHDISRTNGLRTSYVRDLDDAPGWRIGLTATANRKTHPKLPDYDLASLPRDPGTTTAFDLGVGIAKELGATRFGFDVSYIPARSNTWANSDTTIFVAQTGKTITPGGHTVDNHFNFSNIRLATGISREYDTGGWQLGLTVLANDYTLRQDNHVTVRTVHTQESWTEWTPSWGLHRNFGDIALRYTGRLTMKGFPELFGGDDFVTAPSAPESGQDFLVPVTNPVFLSDYTIFTSQFSVSIAIGKRPGQ